MPTAAICHAGATDEEDEEAWQQVLYRHAAALLMRTYTPFHATAEHYSLRLSAC